MKIVKRPLPQVEHLYDITDLTHDEMYYIRAALISAKPSREQAQQWEDLHAAIADGMRRR